MELAAHTEITPDPAQVIFAYIQHYGFDYFFERRLKLTDLDDEDYADDVDEALTRLQTDAENMPFSLSKAFKAIVAEIMDDHSLDYDEALEMIAEEDFVVPVTTALYYSVDVGEADVEKLSALIRQRAKRILRESEGK